MQSQKLYVLKGNVRNPSWELRNQEVLVKKSEEEGLRKIQYVPGADSIWQQDNEKQGNPKSQWFTDGSLSVNRDDKVKILFMESHPDFNVKYELFDPELKAELEFQELETIEHAKEMLRGISDDEDKMAATAASLFGVISLSWGVKTAKLKCYQYADQRPKEIIAAMEDPAAHAKYIAALGFRKNIVGANPQQTAVVWNNADRGVICVVPSGQKPLTVLGEFLFAVENMVTLQEIGKLLTNDDKPNKKKTGKQAA